MPETVGFIKGFFRDNRVALRVAFAAVVVMAGFAFFAVQSSPPRSAAAAVLTCAPYRMAAIPAAARP